MRKTILSRTALLTFVLCLAGLSASAAVESPWTGAAPAVGETYLLYNVKADAFLNGNNNWGTRASLGLEAYPVTIEEGNKLHTVAGYFNDGLYVDTPNQTEWTITAVEGETNVYTIQHGETYIGVGEKGEYKLPLVADFDAVSDACYWQFVTADQALTDMANATQDKPYNATWAIKAANFGRMDSRRDAAWTKSFAGNGGVYGAGGGGIDGTSHNDGNFRPWVFEVWNSGADGGEISQTLTDMPNGTYRLDVQGFYRQGDPTADYNALQNNTLIDPIPAAAFANDQSNPLMSVRKYLSHIDVGTEKPNGKYPDAMWQASEYFAAGAYYGNYVYFSVTDGTAKIGVKKTGGVGSDWMVLGSFSLNYYGDACEPVDVKYADNPDAYAADQETLSKALAAAKDVLDRTPAGEAYDNLSAAVGELQAVVDNPTGAKVFAALATLPALEEKVDAAKPVIGADKLDKAGIETGKEYFLYNVKADGFLTGANNWDTRASLANDAYPVTFEVVGEYARIKTATGTYLGVDNLFTDRPASTSAWDIAKKSDGTITLFGAVLGGDNLCYNKYAAYLGNIGINNIPLVDASGELAEGCYWKLITKAEAVANLANATETAPITATWAIVSSDFDRVDSRRDGAWTKDPSPLPGNGGAFGGVDTNNAFEVWNSNTNKFDFSQTLTDMPNGVYRLTAQAYYRQGGQNNAQSDYDAYLAGTLIDNPVRLYANTDSVIIASIRDGANAFDAGQVVGQEGGKDIKLPNSLGDAANYFIAGAYVNALYFKVTDGTIKLGIYKDNGMSADWVVMDNFQLRYYGAETTPENAENADKYADLLADIKALQADVKVAKETQAVLADGELKTALDKAIADAEAALAAPTAESLAAASEALAAAYKPARLEAAGLPQDGTYYLYNEATGWFLTRGAAWGTAASLDRYGWAFNVSTDAASLATTFRAVDWTGCLISLLNGTDGLSYVDANSPGEGQHTLHKAEGGFTISNNANNEYWYVHKTYDNMNGAMGIGPHTTADNALVFKFMTVDEYEAAIADRFAKEKAAATAAAGIDLTDEKVGAGDVTSKIASAALAGSTEGWTWNGGPSRGGNLASNENGTECYEGTGVLTQTVEGLKPGLYKFTLNAFYRSNGDRPLQYNMAHSKNIHMSAAYIEANGNTARIKNVGDDGTLDGSTLWPNWMNESSDAFGQGKFLVEVFAVVGTDGKLTLKVVQPTFQGACWMMFKNATLTYYAEKDSQPLEITDVKYGTFVAPFAVTLPDGVTAYSCADVDDKNELQLVKVAEAGETLAAGTPVILQSESPVNTTVSGVTVVESATVTAGLLTGVLSDATAEAGKYVLMENNGEAVFGLVVSGKEPTVKAGHCFLTAPDASAPVLRIGGTTNIQNLTGEEAAPVYYDLTGRRVEAPAKGVYILNGKKILVK